jgi:DNA-binding NarL/FixJ family response regulator
MLDDASLASYVRAISAGAIGAVPRDATPADVRETFTAAVAGRSILPTDVVRALASTSTEVTANEPVRPTPREAAWLQDLARGVSVARLADRAGYSERMMFRRLRELYARLGASGRTDALIRARDNGWI